MKLLDLARLGAETASTHINLSFRVKDPNGVLVREKPFHIAIDPYEIRCDRGDGKCTTQHSFSRDTGEDGVVRFDIFSQDGADRTLVISLTPLFGSKWAPENRAILWKKPFVFKEKDVPVDIVLKPGAGLEEKPPASVTPPPPPPSGQTLLPPKEVEDTSAFPWGPVLVGAGILVLGIFLLPYAIRTFGGGKK